MTVKCSHCGAEMPKGAVFCGACGKETKASEPSRSGGAAARCPSCGRSIQPEFKACPYCGSSFVTSFLQGPSPASYISPGKRMGLYVVSVLIPIAGLVIGFLYMSKNDETSKHVGTMCIVAGVISLLVIAPIAGSIILYAMVMGFGSDGAELPLAVYARSTITNGVKITVLSITMDNIPWSDVTLLLSDMGPNSVGWYPQSNDLDNFGGNIANCTAHSLGALTVCCWVCDNAGNGIVDSGDYVTLFTYGDSPTFSSGSQYSFSLLYLPMGERIGNPLVWTA